jgi:hypothetical protein
MMSLSAIRDLSREAAAKAAKENKVPLVLDEHDLKDLREKGTLTKGGGGIPFIGDNVPDGWERVNVWEDDDWPERSKYEYEGSGCYMVDTSGYGSPEEPALTVSQMGEIFKPGFGYALVESGQFQGHIGVFQKK